MRQSATPCFATFWQWHDMIAFFRGMGKRRARPTRAKDLATRPKAWAQERKLFIYYRVIAEIAQKYATATRSMALTF